MKAIHIKVDTNINELSDLIAQFNELTERINNFKIKATAEKLVDQSNQQVQGLNQQ